MTINDPKVVEALQYLLDYQEKGYQPTDADMAGVPNEDLFKQGELAMLTTGIWLIPSFKDVSFKWGIAVEPGRVMIVDRAAVVELADREGLFIIGHEREAGRKKP